MRLALFVSVAVLFSSACGPPPPPGCCGRRTTVARDVVYSGTITPPDGGTVTQVRVNLSTSGNTVVTFINGGHEIVQGFDAVVTFP